MKKSAIGTVSVLALSLGILSNQSALAGGTPLTTQLVAGGLARPLYVTAPPGDTSRIFIVEQRDASAIGRIKIVTMPGDTLLGTPFLSISGMSTGNEEGLLGLAFAPDYSSTGRFYVYYTTGGNNILARGTVSGNPNVANPTLTTLITFSHPTNNNHNGGWIAFGPDGYLYVSTGDGGSGNDPPGNAQNINSYLGKMHRIDVSGAGYTSPPTNPFVGVAGLDEIWAYGLRNPWRCSFDRLTGELYIGDVGQDAVEEISYQPAGAAAPRNYGWRCMEGNNCTGLSGCTCGSGALSNPIYTYANSGSFCSVTGGYVYRGSAIPDLQGTYFFADYCVAAIYSFRYVGGSVTAFETRTTELDPPGAETITAITSFGEDAAGELYICERGSGTNGQVWRIIPGVIDTDPPTPNPMTFAIPPAPFTGFTQTVVSMTATTATDPTLPINYMFEHTGSGAGGNTSAWISGTFYSDGGLTPNTEYSYRVKARDGQNNETAYSAISSTATHIQPPTALNAGVITSTSIELIATGPFTNLNVGNSGLYFDTNPAGQGSGIAEWVQTTTDVATGLQPNTQYTFTVKARNQLQVETTLVSASFTTLPAGACDLLGDINDDGAVNGLDADGFARVKAGIAQPGDIVECADYGTGTLNGDLMLFVADLLN